MIDYMHEALSQNGFLIETRRDLHRHPELAFEETRTAGIVADTLRDLGLEVQTGVGKTGVVGLLEGDTEGPTVLWRADMDALPIQEQNDVDYASTVPGKMHACGHDGHTAIALGLARLFSANREQIAGRIKFVFQPAEEIVGGARAMVGDGVLNDPRPDVCLGLHLWNEASLGTLGLVAGPMMASSSRVEIDIRGHGGHAAMPHKLVDPVICAAHVITALQSIVSRNVDPEQTAVLSITQLRGSDADNIIPDSVTLRGTLRAYSTQTRDLVTERIEMICQSVAQGMGCAADVRVMHGPPPVVNDATVVQRLRDSVDQMLPDFTIDSQLRTMAAEDVSLFMQDIPGAYLFVGSANAERGLNFPHHHARFDFDEAALPQALTVAAAAIGAYVVNA